MLAKKSCYEKALSLFLRKNKLCLSLAEEKEVKKEIDVLLKKLEGEMENEHIVVALAVTSVIISRIDSSFDDKYEEKKEKAFQEITQWLCSFSPAVAMMYLFKDRRSFDFEGVMSCFKEKFKKHYPAL